MHPPARRATALFRKLRQHDAETRHMWTSASAPTREGVTALVQVDFTMQVIDESHAVEDLERSVLDAVEDVVRRRIASSTVAELPVPGDAADWLPADLVEGALVEHAHVTMSDIEVGPALRSLVSGTPGP
ncbi:MAG TPA: hypothetical protein VFG97_06480 [Pedococcus sp.]|nr:hypothetical protein [Pedococcus sp.]